MKDQQLYTVVFKQFVGEVYMGFQGLCYEHSFVLLHYDMKGPGEVPTQHPSL